MSFRPTHSRVGAGSGLMALGLADRERGTRDLVEKAQGLARANLRRFGTVLILANSPGCALSGGILSN